jgi:hypothetical protein
MIVNLVLFITGALAVCGIQTIWFCSNFPVNVSKRLHLVKDVDDVYTWNDWQTWITVRYDFFGELLTCPVCLSVWLSAATLGVQYLVTGDIPSIGFSIVALTNWPALSYLFYKVTGNE